MLFYSLAVLNYWGFLCLCVAQICYQKTYFFPSSPLVAHKKKAFLCFLHCGNDKRGASVIDIYTAVPGQPSRDEVETGLVIQTCCL